MHPNFAFSARQILWVLTFSSQLVLLVVLLGRDRARRYPWFTASIALFALRLLAEDLLAGRMAPLPLQEILLTLADLAAIVSLLVVIEVARRAFEGARRSLWVVNAAGLAAVAGVLVFLWGPWPAAKELAMDSTLGVLRVMQFSAQKLDTFVDLLTVGLGLAVILFGRRFKAGWGTHNQKIAIGLSTISVAWIAIQRSWQLVAQSVHPSTQQEYERLMALGGKLVNANKVVYIGVLLWWIIWLWIDEHGKTAANLELTEEIPADSAQNPPED